ncbi:dipeptidase PepV [Convivina praedatoris]|uniref:dipeptidase PepV n=1 Tax=Convivina praedatoris TaxID=2880963 RepID=UPI00201046B1|nr:dipeptidase PepV [Convivina sp. LMG 32447]CAH1852556.1 Beta-Ala-Xaa dipeptidase [Convivina sp. LMG 32447]
MANQSNQWLKQAQKYQAELLKRLEALIAIPSVYDAQTANVNQPLGAGVAAALSYLENMARQDGFKVRRTAKNMVTVISFGPQDATQTVGILAHTDVVPGGSDWTVTQPFEPKIVHGCLYGRGTHDMKSDLMAAYFAIKQLRDNQFQPKRRIELIIGSDEESNWRDMDNYLVDNPEPTVSFSPDGAFPVVPGEMGFLTLSIDFTGNNQGSWGLAKFDAGNRDNVVPGRAEALIHLPQDQTQIVLRAYEDYLANQPDLSGEATTSDDDQTLHLLLNGVAAHGAYPQLGQNAGTYLANFLSQYPFEGQAQAFLQFIGQQNHQSPFADKLGLRFHNDIMGDLVMNVGQMHFTDKKPSEVHINFRYPEGITKVAMMTQVQRHLRGLQARVYLHHNFISHPHLVDLDDEIVTTLEQVYANQTNTKPSYNISNGGSYARLFNRSVAFGGQFPDVEMTSHQADEYVVIDNISRAQAIFAESLARLSDHLD